MEIKRIPSLTTVQTIVSNNEREKERGGRKRERAKYLLLRQGNRDIDGGKP